MLLSLTGRCCQHHSMRSLWKGPKKGFSREALAWFYQPVDFSFKGILRWVETKREKALVSNHRFWPERHRVLGPDLATAHFVVARHGAVKFDGSSRWIRAELVGKKYEYVLPSVPSKDIRLEAVDMSDTDMMYISFDNFVSLHNLKYLNLAGCRLIDDWCIDRLVQFRDTLLVLDVSRCPLVTERGLATLHKLHRLQRLRMYDMPAVKEKKLVSLLLEEVLPSGCIVEGVDFSAAKEDSYFDAAPTFLQRYENLALGVERERQSVIDSDRQAARVTSDLPAKFKENDVNSKRAAANK